MPTLSAQSPTKNHGSIEQAGSVSAEFQKLPDDLRIVGKRTLVWPETLTHQLNCNNNGDEGGDQNNGSI